MELLMTPATIEKERKRLNRRVKDAYNNMEKWERTHKRRMEELRIFWLRFPKGAK